MPFDEGSIAEVREILCTHFPEPVPEETLYSACARFHRLSANRRPALTGALLFGDERAGRRHCAPQGLKTFARTMRGLLGAPVEILQVHTLGALYLRFMTPSGREEAIAGAEPSSGERRRFQFGWGSARFDLQHPLRSCATCLQEDVNGHGFATWKLKHQLPGVWLCARHQSPLARVLPQHMRASTWLLPGEIGCEVPSWVGDAEGMTWPFLLTIAEVCAALCGPRPIDRTELRRAVVDALAEVGVVRAQRAVNSRVLHRWLRHHVQSDAVSEFTELGMDAGTWASEMFNGLRSQHPLRWAVLCTCLSLEGVDTQSILSRAEGSTAPFLPGFESSTHQLTAPRVAYEILGQGVTMEAAAESAAVPHGAVVRWLKDPELRKCWTKACATALFDRHAAALVAARSSGCRTRQDVRNAAPASFLWMQRNHPDWLDGQLPARDPRFDRQLRLWN